MRLISSISRMHPVVCAVVALATTLPAAAQWTTTPVSAPGVQYQTFHSAAAGATVSFHVYLPPQYDAEPSRSFPVLYWLHGSGDGTLGIPSLASYFGTAMEQGLIPPMIVVFPNGMSYSMWCDSKSGRVPMERVVIDDLLPHVDATFRTMGGRWRIVDGFSMGGQGAGRLGLRRSDLFAGVSMLGAGPMQLDFTQEPLGTDVPPQLRAQIYETVWGSDPAYFLLEHPWTIVEAEAASLIARRTLVRQGVGSLDAMLPANQNFEAHLAALGVPHSFTVVPGVAHSPMPTLSALGQANWNFYNAALAEACRPLTDLDGSGVVDAGDISVLLLDFGSAGGPCDLDRDGVVTASDLSMVLLDFGLGC